MTEKRTFRTALTALVAFVTKTWGGKASQWDNLKESISVLTIFAVRAVNVQHKLKISMLRGNYDLLRLQRSSWLAKILQDPHDRPQQSQQLQRSWWLTKILQDPHDLPQQSQQLGQPPPCRVAPGRTGTTFREEDDYLAIYNYIYI